MIGEWDTSRDFSSLFSFPFKSLQSDEETDSNKEEEQLTIGGKEQAGSRKRQWLSLGLSFATSFLLPCDVLLKLKEQVETGSSVCV